MADSTALLSSGTYLQGLRTHLENQTSQYGAELSEKGMYRQGNIFEPFTQRREMQARDLGPIQHIFSKRALLHILR
ncbi:MAG: hypothetical protein ABI856_19170 [Nitrospira sp.]